MGEGTRKRLLLSVWLCAGSMAAMPKDLASVGRAAPDFKLTTFDGRKISLADLKGEVAKTR
jgi:cytochrome oxidase Cu insertion factor (SCO1/SenC/PrrC family)